MPPLRTEKKRKEGTGHGVDLQDRQKIEPPKKYKVVYNEPTVYQERNVNNLIKDFKELSDRDYDIIHNIFTKLGGQK